MGRVTSFVVADRAKVSQSTVSRALRGDPGIAPATVRRVVRVAKELGYIPSDRARELSSGRTRRIAMMVDLDNPLWSLLVDRLYHELDERGYRLLLMTGHGNQQAREASLFGGSVDGVIVTTPSLQSPLPALLKRRGVPAVLLHRYTDDTELDACVADNVAGAAAAADMLVDAGHRRIAALLGPADTSTGRDRALGFTSRLAEAGVELPEHLVRQGPYAFAFGREAVGDLMALEQPPTALFCANDEIALGAMNGAFELGAAVPDTLAVVGFDDLELAAWPMTSLSTIRVPFADMLRSAVTLLLERIEGYDGPGRRVIHPTRPVPRRTHRPTQAR